MKRTEIRRVLRGLLAVSVVLPFFVFSKTTLMAWGGSLVWLLGYPLAVAVLLALTAESKSSKRVHATPEHVDSMEVSDTVNDETRDRLRARFNNPMFSFLSCNIHHRN